MILWLILIGLLVGFLAQLVMVPWSRTGDTWGLFVLAMLGALLIGLFVPFEGVFLAPFLFWGTLLAAMFGAILLLWLIGLLLVLIQPNS